MAENTILTFVFGPLGLAAIVGLVVWLVKATQKGRDEMTNRFISHLEKNAERQEQKDQRFTDALSTINDQMSLQTETMKSIAEGQRQNMAEFRVLAPQMVCTNFVSRARKTGE